MARPKKQTVDYFPHDSHASDGDTLTVLQNRFGNDGYAFWFKLLEKLASAEGHYLDCHNSTKWHVLLAKLRVDELLGVEIMNMLVEMKAVDKELWDARIIWCQNLVNNVADVYKNRRADTPQRPSVNGNNPVPTIELGTKSAEVHTKEPTFLQPKTGKLQEKEGFLRPSYTQPTGDNPQSKASEGVSTGIKSPPQNHVQPYIIAPPESKGKESKLKEIITEGDKSPVIGEMTKEVFARLDKERGYRPPKRKAEAISIIRMLRAGYTPDQIIETWQALKADPFWAGKELYMMSVESQIGAKIHGTNRANTQRPAGKLPTRYTRPEDLRQ